MWPMIELQAFLEAIESGRNPHLKLLPLFFKISSEDLKDPVNQGRWLSKWKEWSLKNNRIDIDKCRKALKVLKTTKGLVFRECMGEVEYRRIIVNAICQMVPPYFVADLSYVQGSQRICQEMIRKFNQLPCKETRLASSLPILGVYGSVGMGKTTICKILCNYFRKEMVGFRVCHIEIEPGHDLLALQKFAIRQLTGAPESLVKTLRDLDEGQDLLRKQMSKQQVFVAIDNIYTSELSIRMTRMFLTLGLREESLLLVTACTREDLLEVIGYDAAQNCFHVPKLIEIEAIQILLERAIPRCNFASLTKAEQEIARICTSLCQTRCAVESEAEGKIIKYHYDPSSLIKMGALLGGNPKNWIHPSSLVKMGALLGGNPYN